MEAAKRSFARALKGSKKTNAERAKHRSRATSALSRYTRRNPNSKKPTMPPAPQMEEFLKYFIPPKPTGIRLEPAYPKTHIPKKTPVRNTTVARERAQRVANAYTRRLRASQRKPSGVSTQRRARKSLTAISESSSGMS